MNELRVVLGWIFQLLGIMALIAVIPLGLLGWACTAAPIGSGLHVGSTPELNFEFVLNALSFPFVVLCVGIFLNWFGLRLRRNA